MMDLNTIELTKISTHFVGNKLRDEGIKLSEDDTKIVEGTLNYLLKYFILPIRPDASYAFTHSVRLDMNEVFNLTGEIFSNPRKFISNARHLATLLYDVSLHPKIKGGEMNIAYFKNIEYNDQLVDGIGIFKTETKEPFLKMKPRSGIYSIDHENGIGLNQLDKGCLIINTEGESGYRIFLNGGSPNSQDAQHWINDFLNITARADKYHQTETFLKVAKTFVTEQLVDEFEISKAEEIDILNRSIDYFKNNQNFEQKLFEKQVFQDSSIIKSFRRYNDEFQTRTDTELNGHFEISSDAVKKQAKSFKSILKLDKNFHIYIHGDGNLIQKGVEPDGRKYYKVYYSKEE